MIHFNHSPLFLIPRGAVVPLPFGVAYNLWPTVIYKLNTIWSPKILPVAAYLSQCDMMHLAVFQHTIQDVNAQNFSLFHDLYEYLTSKVKFSKEMKWVHPQKGMHSLCARESFHLHMQTADIWGPQNL